MNKEKENCILIENCSQYSYKDSRIEYTQNVDIICLKIIVKFANKKLYVFILKTWNRRSLFLEGERWDVRLDYVRLSLISTLDYVRQAKIGYFLT